MRSENSNRSKDASEVATVSDPFFSLFPLPKIALQFLSLTVLLSAIVHPTPPHQHFFFYPARNQLSQF